MNFRPYLVTSLVLAATSALPGQEFEVAVIRPTRSAPGAGTSFELFPGGRIKIVNEPIKLLIRAGFQLQNSQIAGAPAWVESDRYDIEAQTGRPGKPMPDELAPLLRQLLVSRFHLKFHKEMREIPVHALVPAKGGVKLMAAAPGEISGMNSQSAHGTSQATATATDTGSLASYIGNRLGFIVVDGTTLTGSYDFKLAWAADPAGGSGEASLVTALSEQLGLRLEPRKAPVEHLIIESIERPSEN